MLRYVRPGGSAHIATTWREIRFFASRPNPSEASEEDIKAARHFLSKLDADTIRNNATCDITFSRSSGPGGQNVNKYTSPSPPPSKPLN